MTSKKTHKTAVVLIPPEEVWEPIQAIRREHDRQLRRWMPHVTLVYPFRPRAEFDALAPAIERACAGHDPFEIELSRFECFRHGRRATIWLAPEPVEPLDRLQASIQDEVPDCDDVRRFGGGFTPHLSVGQADARRVTELLTELQSSWSGLRFRMDSVALIWRQYPPQDVFSVWRRIPLGVATNGSAKGVRPSQNRRR